MLMRSMMIGWAALFAGLPAVHAQTSVRIQQAAGIRLPCAEGHVHTETCHTYGFHSFRYGFAQLNYGRLALDELQDQMGHRSRSTTEHYVDFAKRQQLAKADVYVPAALRSLTG